MCVPVPVPVYRVSNVQTSLIICALANEEILSLSLSYPKYIFTFRDDEG